MQLMMSAFVIKETHPHLINMIEMRCTGTVKVIQTEIIPSSDCAVAKKNVGTFFLFFFFVFFRCVRICVVCGGGGGGIY